MNHAARVPTKAIPPLPPCFEQNFIEGGWRRIERIYGCRDDVVLKWIEMCGGLGMLRTRRSEYLRTRAKRYVLGRTLTAVERDGGKG